MATLDVLTIPEAKDILNVTGTAIHDNELPPWITAVSRRLDRLIGPVVRRTVTTERHDGGRSVVWLRHYPITSITSVTEYDGTTATALAAESNISKPATGYQAEAYSVPLTLADGTQVDLLGPALYRRSAGTDRRFPFGRRNIEVTYVAGRFATTATVDELHKRAAGLLLINLWRSQQDAVGISGEFDVPQSSYPRFAVPNSVRQMFPGEIQDADPALMIG